MYKDELLQRMQQRRHAVAECLKEELTSKQIAEELGVPLRTIQKDIKYIRGNQKE